MQRAGLEVRHEENLREHYARTCAAWCKNLDAHWDEAVAEVGEGTARVWALYLAGSQLGFEQGDIQLHQVLAVRGGAGEGTLPLRPDWASERPVVRGRCGEPRPGSSSTPPRMKVVAVVLQLRAQVRVDAARPDADG